MITAEEFDEVVTRNRKRRALMEQIFIRDNPDPVWEFLNSKLCAIPHYRYTININELLTHVANPQKWDAIAIHESLVKLGFWVDFSCSSNPSNETWTISKESK